MRSCNTTVNAKAAYNRAAMKRGFLNVFVFPCPKCNHPISVANVTPQKRPKVDFAGMAFHVTCPRCESQSSFLGIDTQLFEQAEWNFEIR